MKLVVTQGERTEIASIRAHAEGYDITLGDRCYRLSCREAGESASLLIDGEQFEARVRAGRDGRYHVVCRDFGGEVRVRDALAHLAESQTGAAGQRLRRKVTAYMPGRVVAVLAAAGDEVTHGQGVVVLEAMKMENEIQAESSGVVLAIHVVPGQAVEAGEPLFEIG